MEIFKLFGSIFVNTDAAEKSIQKTTSTAEKFAKKLGEGIKTVAKWGSAITTGATAAVGAMVGFASNSASAADEVDKMSQKIGLSKEAYQEWAYVMGQNGMEIDKMQTGMKTLVSQMDSAASGTSSAIDNFDKLGVSIYDINGSLKDQETMMNEVMYALADMENGTEKARLATELFGKSGSEMMPMLNQGSGAMKELTDRAHDLGLIMSEDMVNAGVALGDIMDDVKQSFSRLAVNLGTTLFPILQEVCEAIISNLPIIQGLFAQLAPVITELMGGLLPPLLDLAANIFPILIELVNLLIPPIIQIIESIMPVMIELITTLLPPIIEIVQVLLPILLQLLQPILDLLSPLLQAIQPIIDALMILLEPLIQLLDFLLPPIIDTITVLADVLVNVLADAIKIATDFFNTYLLNIIDTCTAVFTNFIDFFKNIFAGNWSAALGNLRNIFEAWLNGMKNFADNVLNTIAQIFGIKWSDIGENVTAAVNTMRNNVSKAFILIRDIVTNIMTSVSTTLSNIWNGIGNAIRGTINSILSGIESMVNGVIRGVNSVISSIDSVVSAAGEFIGVEWNVPTLSEVSLPKLAKGGVLKKGQVGLLEGDGAEAVVPLEQNTGWINEIAARLNGIAGAGNIDILYDALQEILAELRELNSGLYDKFADALETVRFMIGEKEFARLVAKVVR